MTLKLELGRDFDAVHLPTKFHYRMFNRPEAIVLTYKQTHPQTKRFSQKHPPRYAVLYAV